MAKRLVLATGLGLITALLSGCGTTSTVTNCPAQPLANTASSGSNFTLTPSNAIVTVYPGETTSIPVNVNSVNGSTGTVTLAPTALPQGVTISGGTATIGTTTNLTITTSIDVVKACFTGQIGYWTADRALTISGSNSTGTATTQLDMDVELENKTFQPTTNYLPVMRITTTDAAPVTSEDDYVTGSMTITDSTDTSNNYSGTLGIKGHGNTSWEEPKKPYRLNLDSKAALIGMTSDSNWILLANYDDKTMLRNDVSFQMSQLFGMAWTPSSVFVEMYMNGEYEGVYELTEKVEVSKARLNIGSMDDTDISGEDLTGGYLAEIDHYDGETLMILSQVGLPIGLDDPDPPATEQATYFTTALKSAEGSMYDETNWRSTTNGWQAYWDSGSVVNWFLVEELANNLDASDSSSDYFYKPRSDPKFYRGPVWDMNLGYGNINYSPTVSPTDNYIRYNALWYKRLFDDPAFTSMLNARWQVVRTNAQTLNSYIDTRAAVLQNAQANNFARWPNLGERVWPNPVALGSYQAEVDAMKTWITKRLAYMDSTYGTN
ncbi:MAG: CotH kinase family protein [Acidobacteriaceae bacterium]|nr:CotH kinase family protein [Acidobacteriaceae bacterium]